VEGWEGTVLEVVFETQPAVTTASATMLIVATMKPVRQRVIQPPCGRRLSIKTSTRTLAGGTPALH